MQSYFVQNCDGEWEHEFGIEITTTDNPGWHVQIDVAGTKYEGVEIAKISEQRSPDDWLIIGIKDQILVGSGGPRNLIEILEHLKNILVEYPPT